MAVTTFRAPCTIITLRELRHWPLSVNPLLPLDAFHGCAASFDPYLQSISRLFREGFLDLNWITFPEKFRDKKSTLIVVE